MVQATPTNFFLRLDGRFTFHAERSPEGLQVHVAPGKDAGTAGRTAAGDPTWTSRALDVAVVPPRTFLAETGVVLQAQVRACAPDGRVRRVGLRLAPCALGAGDYAAWATGLDARHGEAPWALARDAGDGTWARGQAPGPCVGRLYVGPWGVRGEALDAGGRPAVVASAAHAARQRVVDAITAVLEDALQIHRPWEVFDGPGA